MIRRQHKIILWFCVNVLNLPLRQILCSQHENVRLNPIHWIWMIGAVLMKANIHFYNGIGLTAIGWI